MKTYVFYNLSLVTHIIGLIMMAGSTLITYVATKQFWKQYAINKLNGIAINQVISKITTLFQIGFTLLILSGISMMAITHGAFAEQIWFRIKLGLIIIIILNKFIIERRQSIKLQNLLSPETSDQNCEAKLLKVRFNLNWIHISQITLFIIVFVLSVFKFK